LIGVRPPKWAKPQPCAFFIEDCVLVFARPKIQEFLGVPISVEADECKDEREAEEANVK
jgi:hypothetical protein